MSKPDLSPYEPKAPRMRPASWRLSIWAGYLASSVFGFLATGVVAFLISMDWAVWGDVGSWTKGVLVMSNFLIIPFGMGLIASYFWKDVPADWYKRFGCGYAFMNFIFAMVGATVILREGAICLLMASPLLGILMAFGSAFGHSMWKKNTFFSASILPLVLLFIVSDSLAPKHYSTVAVTDIHSTAPPRKLWKYVANYPANPHPADFWLWRLGMPMPLKSTGSAEVGGRRDCDLSGGLDVGQRITAVVPNKQLDFVIDRQPKHPESMNHFIMDRGRIELLPDGKGGTIIRGTSWYELKVFPANYFNWWAGAAIHNTHRRVFQWMDELARRDG